MPIGRTLHIPLFKKGKLSDATINIKLDATTRQEHAVGVPLPLQSAFTASTRIKMTLEMVS